MSGFLVASDATAAADRHFKDLLHLHFLTCTTACAICGCIILPENHEVPAGAEWLKGAVTTLSPIKCSVTHRHKYSASKAHRDKYWDSKTQEVASSSSEQEPSSHQTSQSPSPPAFQHPQSSQAGQDGGGSLYRQATLAHHLVLGLGSWSTGSNGDKPPQFDLLRPSRRNLPLTFHTTCLFLAIHHQQIGVLRHHEPCNDQMPSSDFYECLEHRLLASVFANVNWNFQHPCQRVQVSHILDPHNYHGALESQAHENCLVFDGFNVALDRRRADRFQRLARQINKRIPTQYTSDPMIIPGLTDFIILKLKKLDVFARPKHVRKLNKRFDDLPQELRIEICLQLLPFKDPSLLPNRIFAPEWWRDALPSLIPWLWDLDWKQIDQYLTKHKRITFDWELLVRQLGQTSTFEGTSLGAFAPWGLRNRRRIWRLLEEMEVGDTREMPEVKDALERWKGRSEYYRDVKAPGED